MPSVACRLGSAILIAAALPLLGQVALQVLKVELAVPFGVASGRLVTVSDYMVFTDDDQPGASFAVARSGVRELSLNGDVLNVVTAAPLRDRGGERSKFAFRLMTPAEATKLTEWFKAGPAAAPPSTNAEAKTPQTYQVKHDHLMGSCNGRLMIEEGRLVFESITDISHSRQWSMRDIKELKRDNPYGIKVIPFSGDAYNFGIEGRGMDSDDYHVLVDRITAARAKQ